MLEIFVWMLYTLAKNEPFTACILEVILMPQSEINVWNCDNSVSNTGFFDRNIIFKLLIFQPKDQYFSEPKYVLKRLLLDILKNKCSLQNMNNENCEINWYWWGFVFAILAENLTDIKCVLLNHLHCFYCIVWIEWYQESIISSYLLELGNI